MKLQNTKTPLIKDAWHVSDMNSNLMSVRSVGGEKILCNHKEKSHEVV